MKSIYNILKEGIVAQDKTYISLEDFYNLIEENDREMRRWIDYPDGYLEFVQVINRLIDEKFIEATKNSRDNSRTPSLKLKYRIIKTDPSYDDIKLEIMALPKPISIQYYLSHPKEYMKDREHVLIIAEFLKNGPKDFRSVNERSYQLFRDEKFLKDNERILANLGLSYGDLNCFIAYEPFFYFSHLNCREKLKRKALIVENKDTFWSFKKIIFDEKASLDFDVLIYGEGRKIESSFQFVEACGLSTSDDYLYFGDLDPEGINIFCNLKRRYSEYKIVPYLEGYCQLIYLWPAGQLGKIKTKQKLNLDYLEEFAAYFDDNEKDIIKDIINNGLYIPQEGLSFAHMLERWVIE